MCWRRLTILLVITAIMAGLIVSCGNVESPIVKEAVDLTPEEQAVEMVENFLWLCKQGRLQEAKERFIREPERGAIAYPAALEDIGNYYIKESIKYDNQEGTSPYIVVTADIAAKSIWGIYQLLFRCDETGKYIIGIEQLN
jgi:hypothetical protein